MVSQLKLLKQKISDAGLSRTSQTKKTKKNSKGSNRREKLDHLSSEMNIFDMKQDKRKFEVVTRGGAKDGKKLNNVSLSKSKAVETRRKTLLPLLEARHHDSTFIDNRIGEGANSQLDPEEKQLQRFAMERKNSNKFDLDDDANLYENDEFMSLTHGGRKLEEEEEPARKKTHAEIMQEVMAKSKAYKAERQKVKSHDTEKRLELDDELRDIRGLLNGQTGRAAVSDDESDRDEEKEGEDAEESDADEGKASSESESDNEDLDTITPVPTAASLEVDRDLLKNLIGSDSESEAEEVGDKKLVSQQDEYDKFVRMLAMEPRAQPTDRLKTPLELAEEEKKQLEAMEAKRLKRQRGEEESDSETENNKKRKRAPQGDDLEDDFVGDDESDGGYGFGKGLEGEESGEGESGDESQSGESDASESFTEGLEDAPEGKTASGSSKDAPTDSTLPYTFPCPASHSELLHLLKKNKIPQDQTPVVVKRIRVLYHPGLAPGNKEKLGVFAGVLLEHVMHLADTLPEPFEAINALLPQLLTLSHNFALPSAESYIEEIKKAQDSFLTKFAFPSLGELTLFRLAGVTWSTSDLSHPVCAPALLLMCEYLSQTPVKSLSDISRGLFLCTVIVQYESVSKRLVPEALNFLYATLITLFPMPKTAVPGEFPLRDISPELSLLKHSKAALQKAAKGSLSATLSADYLTATENTPKRKMNILLNLLGVFQEYLKLYISHDATIELFSPLVAILETVQSQHADTLPDAVSTALSNLKTEAERVLRLSRSTRKPLKLQAHRAIALPSYIPKFEESFNPNTKFDPDTERAQANKLRNQYKKERKGAIRELRRDNQFIAMEEQKKKIAANEEYNKKMSRVMSSLQDERAEEKEYERVKERTKRADKKRRG